MSGAGNGDPNGTEPEIPVLKVILVVGLVFLGLGLWATYDGWFAPVTKENVDKSPRQFGGIFFSLFGVLALFAYFRDKQIWHKVSAAEKHGLQIMFRKFGGLMILLGYLYFFWFVIGPRLEKFLPLVVVQLVWLVSGLPILAFAKQYLDDPKP